MKVAIYARCGTVHQDIDMQLFDLREYCSRHNYEIFKEYTDIESGSKEQREQLSMLMEDAHKKLFDIVLVWRFDRFSRSLKQLVTSLEYLRNKGIKFISFNDNVDTTTPSGELLFNLIGCFAQFERQIIQERVKAGIRCAREKGVTIGRPRKKLDKELIKQFLNTMSIREVARKFNVSPATIIGRLRNNNISHISESTRNDATNNTS
jgi:DNA invertase Pin-like site-specific DNA recombinase